MSRALLSLAMLSLVLVTACAASPAELCRQRNATLCERMHACAKDQILDQDNDGVPDFEERWGRDAASCEAMWLAGFEEDLGGTIIHHEALGCDAKTTETFCDNNPSGSTLDIAAARSCADEASNLSCSDFLASPTPDTEACKAACS